MTPTLLENEKVWEFFGCHCRPEANIMGEHHQTNCSDAAMALRVLEAMSEPILKGAKLLGLSGKEWKEYTWETKPVEASFHPYDLVLPPQPQRPPSARCFHKSGGMSIEHPCPECMVRPLTNPKNRKKIAKKLIDLFENEDCDTMGECEELCHDAGIKSDYDD